MTEPDVRPPPDPRLLERVTARAEEVLGDPERARRWLLKGNPALGGERPLDMLTNDAGAVQVERVLGRIEHGIVG